MHCSIARSMNGIHIATLSHHSLTFTFFITKIPVRQRTTSDSNLFEGLDI